MDFNIHDFLLSTVRGLVGNRPDYLVRELAMGWYTKGVFAEEDLAGVEAALAAKNAPEPDAPDGTDADGADSAEPDTTEPGVTDAAEPDAAEPGAAAPGQEVADDAAE